MTDNVGEIIRCLLRDLGTYGASIRYAERVAAMRDIDTTYAEAAARLRLMQRAACDLADKRNRKGGAS